VAHTAQYRRMLSSYTTCERKNRGPNLSKNMPFNAVDDIHMAKNMKF